MHIEIPAECRPGTGDTTPCPLTTGIERVSAGLGHKPFFVSRVGRELVEMPAMELE
ncbi:MAG: hypothetical protein HY791_19630 [Deltaproteobacteria bacterium]|nr:hypothetical protein [Deltaproteobacteria bacterium]